MMYQISNAVSEQSYKGLQVKKMVSNVNPETLMISIEEGNKFPEHTSPRDAFLMMLEGEVEFHINQKMYRLKNIRLLAFLLKFHIGYMQTRIQNF